MTRHCRTCGKQRSALLAVCPEDGTALTEGPVELSPQDERSISIDVSTHSPMPASPAVSDETLAPGTRVGEYIVEDVIGSGGGGTVYRAAHAEIGKRVAIKVIHRNLAQSASAVGRFFDEARTVNAINHPSLVDIFSVGRLPDERPFLVMELLPGRPLSAALRQGALTMPEKLRIVDQVCVALDAAHGKNVVHRDLKPDNIFLVAEGNGLRVKLLDFGVAKLLEPGSGQSRENTRTGVVLGTPVYMSPEQILGDQLGPPADVYALGVVLYRLFTGRPPFLADTTVELFMQHIQKAPPLPDELSPLVPLRLSRLMHQMLAKNPVNRPTLTAVRAAAVATLLPNSKLASVLAPIPARATALQPRAPTNPVQPAAPETRNSAVWVLGGALALTLVIAWQLTRSPAMPTAQAFASPPPSSQELPPAQPDVVAPSTPAMARLELTVVPSTAEVRFDQQRVSTSSGVAIIYGAPDRAYSLMVSSPGFVPRTEQLRFTRFERRALSVSLEPEPAPTPVPRPKPVVRSKPKQSKELIDPF